MVELGTPDSKNGGKFTMMNSGDSLQQKNKKNKGEGLLMTP